MGSPALQPSQHRCMFLLWTGLALVCLGLAGWREKQVVAVLRCQPAPASVLLPAANRP